jgi:hypothetical protein
VGQRPKKDQGVRSTGSIWMPISRTTGGVGFCSLDRAVGVNPRSALREETRLVVGGACSMFHIDTRVAPSGYRDVYSDMKHET